MPDHTEPTPLPPAINPFDALMNEAHARIAPNPARSRTSGAENGSGGTVAPTFVTPNDADGVPIDGFMLGSDALGGPNRMLRVNGVLYDYLT